MPGYLQGCPGAEAKWGIAPGPGPRSPGRMGAAVQIQEEGIAPFKTSPDVSCCSSSTKTARAMSILFWKEISCEVSLTVVRSPGYARKGLCPVRLCLWVGMARMSWQPLKDWCCPCLLCPFLHPSVGVHTPSWREGQGQMRASGNLLPSSGPTPGWKDKCFLHGRVSCRRGRAE